MYLGHFGLSEQPFAHPSITDFFYEGANRGATLDALIYILTHGEGTEGVIQVTGDAGSGKTALCRLLMKRLPAQVQTVYFAKPNFSPEELLRSIADELISGVGESSTARNTVAIEDLQRMLTGKYTAGGRIVLLVDEAHTMPAETLEEALKLYDLESPRHKLLQIVLFGQAELKNTLASPSIRKFRDRFTHHFVLQPFDARAVEEYLMCRVRAAGYRGPRIFSPGAVRWIARASRGLIPQLDVLADKSMLAASIAQAHEIKAHHAKTACADSGLQPHLDWGNWGDWGGGFGLLNGRRAKVGVMVSTVAVAVLGTLGWQTLRSSPAEVTSIVASGPLEVLPTVPASVPMPAPIYPTTMAAIAPGASASLSAPAPTPSALPGIAAPAPASAQDKLATAESQSNAKLNIAGVKLAEYALLEQRVEATRKTLAATDKNFYTIQLFTTDNVQPDRMERFLARARGLTDLSNLYVHTVNDGEQAKFRVTYGIYSSRDEATTAVAGLPPKYQSAFHPELYTLSELR